MPRLPLSEALAAAERNLHAGRWAEAAAICTAILRSGESAEAHRLLGLGAHLAGDAATAEAELLKAVALPDATADAWANLGLAYHTTGRLREAEEASRRALALDPDFAQAANDLGIALERQGRLAEAEAAYRRAVAIKGDFAGALVNQAKLAYARGAAAEAEGLLRRAIGLRTLGLDHRLLAVALQAQERLAEAESAWRRSLDVEDDAEGYSGLASTLLDREQLDEAEACLRRALALNPSLPSAHNNLAALRQKQRRLTEAEAAARHALALRPQYDLAQINLAAALLEQGLTEEALAAARRAVEINPLSAKAKAQLGGVLFDLGRCDDAEAAYRQALAIAPRNVQAGLGLAVVANTGGRFDEARACLRQLDLDVAPLAQAMLGSMLYWPEATRRDLADEHRRWNDRFAAPWKKQWGRWAVERRPQRRLAVGFVSPDFGFHPVGAFFIRALESFDRARIEPVLYSTRFKRDAGTERFRKAAGRWREAAAVGDEALAELVRQDKIDILVDLTGHTRGNRMLLFARKPAPVQFTWIGSESTTGLEAIDCLLGDDYQVRPGEEVDYREEVVRLGGRYVAFDPMVEMPAVGPPPALRNGHITFGSFSNPSKLADGVLDTWAELLRRLPTARLILKYRGLDQASIADRIGERFRRGGIEWARIELRPWTDVVAMRAEYGDIDIALDTFPFSGSATTFDALWMGVPVVTLPQETFVSRHSGGHLVAAGLDEWVAADRDDYVNKAVALAADIDQLVELRRELRDRVAASSVCDGARLAAEFTRAAETAWGRWCAE